MFETSFPHSVLNGKNSVLGVRTSPKASKIANRENERKYFVTNILK